jgi:hypothetical protein
MLKNFLYRFGCNILVLLLVVMLSQPLALATEKDKSGSDKKTATTTTIGLAEILQRLEQAEAAVAAATARATELTRQVEEMRRQLKDTEQKLQYFKESESAKGAAEVVVQEQEETEPETEPETVESLTEHLAELRDQVTRHERRLEEYSQTRVETGERLFVRLFGTVLFNSYYNSAGTFDPPTGLYLLSTNGRSLENGSNFGSTIRQTQLGLAFRGPAFQGWKLSGDLQLDFFGGNPPVYNGRAFSPLRLRIARMRLETLSEKFSLVVGQDDPIISPLNPTSQAQVGFPALAESGNLWSWTPQAKVAYRIFDRKPDDEHQDRLILEGAVLAPYNGQTNRVFQFETRPDAGERGRLPAFEMRLAYQRGNFQAAPSSSYLVFDKQPFQVGAGVHYARQLAVPGRIINSTVVAGDYILPLGERVTLSGELFWGRSLSGLGGGIVQGIVFPIYGRNPIGIRSRGGWSQLQIRPATDISINFAYGTDDPYNKDLVGTRFELAGGTSRTVNRTASANILYRFRTNFIMSAEYRYMQTFFTEAPKRHNNHVNLGFSYLF